MERRAEKTPESVVRQKKPQAPRNQVIPIDSEMSELDGNAR